MEGGALEREVEFYCGGGGGGVVVARCSLLVAVLVRARILEVEASGSPG